MIEKVTIGIKRNKEVGESRLEIEVDGEELQIGGVDSQGNPGFFLADDEVEDLEGILLTLVQVIKQAKTREERFDEQ